VLDVNEARGRGTGFKFLEYAPWALQGALERALAAHQDPTAWRQIQQAGMRRDSSWDASAREYVKVYRAI
jgi:starch synthase